MKKRIVSTLLALCMLLCLMPTAAFAEGSTETPPVCSCETACTADNMNKECPVCGAEGALLENCAKCDQPAEGAAVQPEDSADNPPVCSCETACTAESMNADCPVCGAEGALPDNCAKYAQPAEGAAVQPEGEVSDPQPEAALTALSGEGGTPAAGETVRDVRTADELTAAFADTNVNTVKLTANIDISSSLTVKRTVTLDLNGYALTVSGTEWDIFSVDENGNLTVKDSGTGGKIDGQNNNCGFSIHGGILTLESGTITNCTTDGDGGAVDISSGDSEGVYGKFVMNGGAITNCKATDDSGAVDIGNGCTFIMNSGIISGCRADDDAGAIFIKGNASFVMNGGTIENCFAGYYGGAVKIRDTGSFTMTAGTISNCTAQQGGGVYVDDSSTFNMNGGSIANCTAAHGGNSVFVMSRTGGKFTMTDGTVDGSVTLHYTVAGSDVYMDGLGTAAYPYQIGTAAQLKLFRDIVNGSNGQTPNRGACAVLMNDIVLNDGTFDENGNYTTGASGKAVETWTPIAYSGPFTVDTTLYYTGTFDGQGHAIKGMYVSINDAPSIEDQVCLGLFSTAKNAVIRNVTVTGYVSGYAGNLGGIVGYLAGGTIENCANYCTVTDTLAAPEVTSYVGGIAGAVNCSAAIRDCYNTGKLTEYVFVKYHKTGGIVGYIGSSAVSNCYNVGKVAGKGWYNGEIIGFIAGEDAEETPSTINNCYYLNTTNKAVGNDADTVTNTGPKTAVQFGDGTVLKLLINSRDDSEHPWNSQCQYLAAAGSTLPVFKTQTGDGHTHDWSGWTSNDDGTHSRRCACNAAETANCSGGTATCTQKAKCTVCGAEYGDYNFDKHTGTEQWTQTPTTHEKKWNCCNTVSVPNENHEWADGVCSECGYVCQHEDADKNHICDICNKKISDHSGGTATCIAKAVCEICKESYGSPDLNNHTDLKHIDAKAATAAEEGNIEYWYCGGCGKYFSDAAAKTEITKAKTVTAKLPPKITAGDGAAVTQGEKNELAFTSNASFADFLRVELDGATLDEKNYTKREGSTIITLNRDFVAALSVGEHTLAIVSQHGTATAKFTVKAKPAETATPQPTETTTPQPTAQPQQTAQPQPTVQPTVQPVSPIPRTGDTANPALWFALLIVSGSALAAISILRRKANRK